ncbi:MAG: GatB/YqeY domain-containing protein [Rhodobacteraceae bacterium]|nr:GatB/YqeY domain-containing protein [Paracoccaceae bacterium]
MGLKKRVDASLQQAMRDKDRTRVCTLRLIAAAIKDQEIAKRGSEEGVPSDCSDDEIRTILAKMIRQRKESVRAYEEAGRLELAEQERAEADIIASFLPRPLSEDEKRAAIDAAIADAGAGSLRDMGKVMGLLKERHAGRMDFAAVGPEVRDRLAS